MEAEKTIETHIGFIDRMQKFGRGALEFWRDVRALSGEIADEERRIQDETTPPQGYPIIKTGSDQAL